MTWHAGMQRCVVFGGSLLVATAMATTCIAAEIDTLTITHRDRGFSMKLDAVVDAPTSRVHAVLTDYARLGKLNPVITATSVKMTPNGQGDRVRTVIDGCVWFFCRQIVQVEDVTEPDPSTIIARIVPGAGDFESGQSYWRVTNEGQRTRLHYEAVRVAGFWIPPLIGPWAIDRTLREEFRNSVATLERLANQKSPHTRPDRGNRTVSVAPVPGRVTLSSSSLAAFPGVSAGSKARIDYSQ